MTRIPGASPRLTAIMTDQHATSAKWREARPLPATTKQHAHLRVMRNHCRAATARPPVRKTVDHADAVDHAR